VPNAIDQKNISQEKATLPGDKLYMENTLLRVAGALFCHDAKRASSRTQGIELNKGVADKNIVLRPDPRLGQPGPLAHKIFVALIKKHSNYGRPIRAEVSFTKRELMRLIGRSGWGGRHSEQLSRALDEIHHAFIRTKFKTKDGRSAEHSFNIFPEVYLERAENETDPIERCTVTLARPIIQSLQDEHFTCLNHALMLRLGTIGQALYMRLHFHFANLHQDGARRRPTFSKRYDDICAEWLGGLTVLKYKSTIEREQLGSHLRQLRQANFLASYAITEAASGDGFVITFRPGAAFLRDYERFYRGRHQSEMQFEFHNDAKDISQPLKMAYLFLEKRAGRPVRDIPYVSSKEVETAKQLLSHVRFEQMPDFLDYALAEAKKTNFDVRTLGGLKQYLSGYGQRREQRVAKEATARIREIKEREEAQGIAYDRYRRQSGEALFRTLLASEQAVIEDLARKRGSYGTSQGPLATTLYEIAKARITAERHVDRIMTFEDWRIRKTA
jgi:hypothetical protein